MIGFDGHKRIKGTKIHAVVTPESLPVAVAIGSAREHEGRRLIPLTESISVRQDSKRGRPRKRPRILCADTKYSMPLNKIHMRRKRVGYQIPNTEKRRKPGRPVRFDRQTYNKIRYSIERFFAWIKSFRRIIIRYERLTSTYLGFIHLACITIYLRILK